MRTWAQVTYSILANTVLVLVVPLFTTTDLETEKTGEMKIDSKTNPFESPVLQAVFNVLRSPWLRGPNLPFWMAPWLNSALLRTFIKSQNARVISPIGAKSTSCSAL